MGTARCLWGNLVSYLVAIVDVVIIIREVWSSRRSLLGYLYVHPMALRKAPVAHYSCGQSILCARLS